MGKTHSKTLASRHGRGTAWARHAMCESALNGIANLPKHWDAVVRKRGDYIEGL
jgi:hypothetical protein